ncbi:MAG: Gfo/Idh/MocA family oxidoreductase [Pirellulaceae bacterium]|jgi:predicted dehydrogenase|nr:Gfo/Idh/MocA family oxidoreductase [Mariniblastus sp.]MDB4756604.1 Gfo/Idh/MocA family oxidoreductase [Mariniblastus sp.]MDG2470415.1 Gfo/Idh/MocA family oxidoreductase [Pirellulaceae bacterium]
MKLNVGLIGIGDDWENRHRPALKTLSDRFEVKGVCSDTAIKSRKVAQDFGAIQFDGFRSLIQREDIDAVLCLAKDWVGPLPMFAACDHGKAIYSSSALGLDQDRANQVKQRVEDSGVAFMAEFAMRHTPATNRLKELIATRLGQPKMIFCTERIPQSGTPNGKSINTNKLLMELIDWCSYIIGEVPCQIQGSDHRFDSQGNQSEYKLVSLGYEDDRGQTIASSQISISGIIPSEWQDALGFRRPAKLQINCENGVAYIDSSSTLIWFDKAGQHTESLDADRPVGEQLLTLFHRAVTSLIRKTDDLEDAFRARRMIDVAQQCFQTGECARLE